MRLRTRSVAEQRWREKEICALTLDEVASLAAREHEEVFAFCVEVLMLFV